MLAPALVALTVATSHHHSCWGRWQWVGYGTHSNYRRDLEVGYTRSDPCNHRGEGRIYIFTLHGIKVVTRFYRT